MSTPGLGVMIQALGGNEETVKAHNRAVGRVIQSVALEPKDGAKNLVLTFSDGSTLTATDDGVRQAEGAAMSPGNCSPGPFTITGPSKPRADAPEGGDYAIRDADGQIIAETFYRSSEQHTHNAKANAALFMQAPELLKALLEADNALADYIPQIEATGASLNYGRSVMRQIRAIFTALREQGAL